MRSKRISARQQRERREMWQALAAVALGLTVAGGFVWTVAAADAARGISVDQSLQSAGL